MRTVYIYGLWDCRDGRLRYVGKTVNLKARLRRHCLDYDRGKITHCSTWVKGLLNEGLEPMMEILEECTEENWQDAERGWIADCIKFGVELTNMVDGGSGGAQRGRKLSEETKEKISQKLKGRIVTWAKPLTDYQKEKMNEGRRKNGYRVKPFTPEHKYKIGRANAIALKGRKVNEKEREHLRQMLIKRWKNKQ